MTLDGRYVATVDRVVDGEAVLLVESDGDVVAERRRPLASLPADVEEGTVCTVRFDDGTLREVTSRPSDTESRRRRLREQLDRLSRRLSDEE